MNQYVWPKFWSMLLPFVLYSLTLPSEGVILTLTEFLFHFIGKVWFRWAMLCCPAETLIMLKFYIKGFRTTLFTNPMMVFGLYIVLYMVSLGHGHRLRTFRVFTSPEPKVQDELLWSLAICLCLSVHTFEQLPLWNSSYFMWNLLLKGDWKFVQMVMVF